MKKFIDKYIVLPKKNSVFLKITFVLIVSAIYYWQDLALLTNEAINNEVYSHIIAVPFLLTYILYRLRKIVYASILQYSSSTKYGLAFYIGLLLCFVASLVKLVGSYTFLSLEMHIISIPVFVSGLILVIFNSYTLRYLSFPIAFLALLVPPPLEFLQFAGSILSVFSSRTAYVFLNIIGLPVSFTDSFGSPMIVLTTTDGTSIPFVIDLACSGLYSLIGFFMFAIFIAYIIKGPFINKIYVFIMGFPLIYALNIIRIILIIVIGYLFGENIALYVFHTFGGWILIFLGTIFLMIIGQKVLKINFFNNLIDECSHLEVNENNGCCVNCGRLLIYSDVVVSKDDIITFILVLIMMIPLLIYQVPVFTLSESAPGIMLKGSIGEERVTDIFPEIKGFNLFYGYRDRDFENVSGQDASIFYFYKSKETNTADIWVGLEIGPTLSCLHRWEACYVSYPQEQGKEPKVEQLDLRDIHLIENPPLSGRYFAYKDIKSNYTEVILYWRFRSVFQTLEGYQMKWVKISVIHISNSPENVTSFEAQILPIASTIVEYWKPIREWSWISLLIAKNGMLLILAMGIILAGVVVYNLYVKKKEKKRAKILYNLLSISEDRQIIDSVKALENEIANECTIAVKLKEYTKKDVDIKLLHNKLLEAEESGIIKRILVSLNDEPYLSWKTSY